MNIIVQPMLDGQKTSLENLFDGNSYDSIMTGVSPIIAEFGSGLDQSISQVAQIDQMTQSLYTAGTILDGAGTILEPLIIIAGPGIVTTLFDLIGSKIVDFLITPLIDQFSSSVLESYLNDISAGFGNPESLVNQASEQNQKSTDFLIRGKIGTQQYETQQYGPIHPEGSYCSLNDVGCQISDLLSGLIDFVNQIGTAILNEAINPFVATIEMIISGLFNIFGELLDPAHRLTVVIGFMSVIDDLLGGIKSKLPSSVKPIIQFARLSIESFQTNAALYKLLQSVNSNYFYDGLISFFWVIKSANSLISDSLSFISDLFYYIPTLETSIGQIINDHLNGKTVKQYLYDLRAKLVFVSLGINLLVLLAKDEIFPNLQWSEPLTDSQLFFSLIFFGGNLFESFLKFKLYSSKAHSKPLGNNFEFYTYVGSSVLDGVQAIATVSGII